ncbi:MAG: aminotransferase class IV [Phycisphaerales bacterium]|nr:MAG: aminotransferase class IV [Phycisphaerales bacterium]
MVVSYNKRLFLLDEHMKRLRRSAAAIQLDYDFDGAPLEPIIEEGLKRCGLTEAMVYVQITRGVAPRAHPIPRGIQPTVVMTFKPLPKIPADLRQRGVSMMIAPEKRWARCFIKAVTLLPNVLAKTEAVRRGYFDAIFVTDSGEVRESTSANVFIAKDGQILTPRRDESILHGITQGFLMDCAKDLGLVVEERVVDLETLRGADEVFLSGTTVEVLAVTSIDDEPVGDGLVGPMTRRLYETFRVRVKEESDAEGLCKPSRSLPTV